MKKFYRSSAMTGLLFVTAVIFLLVATVGGAQAALTAKSNNYYSALSLKSLDVDLVKTGTGLNGEYALIGKDYPYEISAKNTGEIPQYVRAVVYRYWKSDEGKVLDTSVDPGLITTGFENNEAGYNDSNWYLDKESSTVERQIYYYKTALSVGETTERLFDGVRIDPKITKTVKIGSDGRYSYVYNGLQAVVDIELDAIQTHHARDAMHSAWGVSDDLLSMLGIPNE
jgi:hypothetical protein